MAAVTRRWRVLGGAMLVTVALAACQIVPPPPLMSPIQVAGEYGYSEVPLGPGRYDVTYVGPSRRSPRSPSAWRATGAAERTQAYDFALWRAAQLALALGYEGFRVSNVRSNVSTIVDNYDDFFYGPAFGPGFYAGPWPYRYSGWWGPPLAPSPYAYQQTAVSLDAQLLHNPGPGDYNAADTVAQLRRTYPGAEGAPAATKPPG